MMCAAETEPLLSYGQHKDPMATIMLRDMPDNL